MTTFKIRIQPVSPGMRGGHGGLGAGTGQYATTPQGERDVTIELTQAQIVGLQGYLVCLSAGLDTSTIETAITAVGPT